MQTLLNGGWSSPLPQTIWTPERLREILKDVPGALRPGMVASLGASPSLCVGCPNRQSCERGHTNAFYVLNCQEPLDDAVVKQILERRLGTSI